MRNVGRFSVAALHCLFSLAALSCKASVVSVLPTKAADGDANFASVAEEHISADPQAVARASVSVEADGSALARQQEVNPNKISTDVASEGDVGKRVVIGADGSMDGDVGDDRIVRQKTSDSDGLAEDQAVEDGSAGVSEHARFDSKAAAHIRTRGGGDVILVLLFLILITALTAGGVFAMLYFKVEPPALRSHCDKLRSKYDMPTHRYDECEPQTNSQPNSPRSPKAEAKRHSQPTSPKSSKAASHRVA